jgi:hypothetical protein
MSNDDLQYIDINKINMGDPQKRSDLTEEMLQRIKNFKEIFKDVDGSSLEQTLKNFYSESDPESEIQVWEKMAKAYDAYLQENPGLDLDKKGEVFKTVLLASMGSVDTSQLALGREEIERIIQLYTA